MKIDYVHVKPDHFFKWQFTYLYSNSLISIISLLKSLFLELENKSSIEYCVKKHEISTTYEFSDLKI